MIEISQKRIYRFWQQSPRMLTSGSRPDKISKLYLLRTIKNNNTLFRILLSRIRAGRSIHTYFKQHGKRILEAGLFTSLSSFATLLIPLLGMYAFAFAFVICYMLFSLNAIGLSKDRICPGRTRDWFNDLWTVSWAGACFPCLAYIYMWL